MRRCKRPANKQFELCTHHLRGMRTPTRSTERSRGRCDRPRALARDLQRYPPAAQGHPRRKASSRCILLIRHRRDQWWRSAHSATGKTARRSAGSSHCRSPTKTVRRQEKGRRLFALREPTDDVTGVGCAHSRAARTLVPRLDARSTISRCEFATSKGEFAIKLPDH